MLPANSLLTDWFYQRPALVKYSKSAMFKETKSTRVERLPALQTKANKLESLMNSQFL